MTASDHPSDKLAPLPERLLARLTRIDRAAIIVATIAILGSLAGLGWRGWLARTSQLPVPGGSYTEGIVAASLADVTPTLDRLTKIGLVGYDDEGAFVPAAATSWEVSADGKTYTFALREGVNRDVVTRALEDAKALFPGITSQVTEENRVVFTLPQAFAPFLATTASPILPYGPYRLTEQTKGVVRLLPNPEALGASSYLQEIVLRIYPDSFNLTQALASGEIQGVADVASVENDRLLERLEVHSVSLPRKILLFFNTDRDPVKATKTRYQLKHREPLEVPIKLTLVTLSTPHHQELAEQLAKEWEPLGAAVSVQTQTATELATKVVPNRSYDALIYGLDFGGDPDPYPFWHSSQIGPDGLNLSNFAHIDADRLLEKARQTQDAAARQAAYQDFAQILDIEVPAFELEQVSVRYGTDRGLRGVRSHAGLAAADRFLFVAEWYRKTRREAIE